MVEPDNVVCRDNQTFCVCFYEPLYDKLSLGVIYQNANELTVLSIDNKKDSFVITSSFQFGQYDATLKKTWGHLLGVRTNVRNTLTFYSIVDAEALIEPMKAHVSSLSSTYVSVDALLLRAHRNDRYRRFQQLLH